jgi:beta-lactamase regulating signal transducer with metallopeptidase domain
MPFISQSNFLQALGWAVANSLWQMALLWLIYRIFLFTFRPVSSLKSKSAFVMLLSGTGWFLFTFIKSLVFSGAVKGFKFIGTGYSLNDQLSALLPYTSVIYLVLLSVPAIRFLISLRQVQQLRTRKIQKIEIHWRLFVKKMSACLEIRKPVQVWISENISTPVTVGFLKPVILIPLAAVNKLNTEQMEAVLLHELAHIRRYDYFINIITVIIRSIFYFNPFTRSLAGVIEEEREKTCDEWVLQYQYNAYAYSSALLTLEQMKRHSLQLALAAASHKELLLERIKKIMGIPSEPAYSVKNNLKWIAGITASALLFIFLFSGSYKIKESKQTFENSFFAYINAGVNEKQNYIYSAGQPALAKKAVNKPSAVTEKKDNSRDEDYPSLPETNENNSFFVPVGFSEAEAVAELEELEEVQVKEAVDASKKILKDVQLSELKSAAADALSKKELETLKKYFEKEIEKADWHKLEDRLRTSYNNIDWKQVNAKIEQEIKRIRLDSMVNVYHTALNSLRAAESELQAEKLKGIPDSRYTLAIIDSAKKTMELSLQQLKAAKEKKIIRL